MDHLNKSLHKYLEKTDDERILKILSDRWIGYSRANEVINKLEDLLRYPKKIRMPNFLIVGETNNGKTMLVRKFCKMHPPNDNPEGDKVHIPVLYISSPANPDEGRLYGAILKALFARYKTNNRLEKKEAQAMELMKYIDVKLLIIDEIQHLLAGGLNKQRVNLNVIKSIGNELQIPIIGVGVKSAYRALNTSSQMSNRFKPLQLPKWRSDDVEYYRLLSSFEKMIPLKKPSNLIDAKIAQKIFMMSEGFLGEISDVITSAAVEAVRKGEERINLKLLNELDWTQPSKRKTDSNAGK